MTPERRRDFIAMGWGFLVGALLIAPWAYAHASRKARKPEFILPLAALLIVAPGGTTGALVALLIHAKRSRKHD